MSTSLSIVYLDLSIAVLDCCTWWRIAMIVRGGHLVDCALGHSRDLGPGVDDSVDHALLADKLARTGLGLTDAV